MLTNDYHTRLVDPQRVNGPNILYLLLVQHEMTRGAQYLSEVSERKRPPRLLNNMSLSESAIQPEPVACNYHFH